MQHKDDSTCSSSTRTIENAVMDLQNGKIYPINQNTSITVTTLHKKTFPFETILLSLGEKKVL